MRRAAWMLVAALAAVLALAWIGGAIHWDREPPYQLAASWGGAGSAPGQFNEPTGIAVSQTEVFVADARNHRIQVFDRAGRFRRAFGAAVLQRPMNLSWRAGRLYVADFFADAIFVFDAGGRLEARIAAADGLKNPGGVDVFADGSLLVADTYHHRVLRLGRDGTVLRQWGGEPGSGAGAFNYPADVAVRGDGGFTVADGYNDRVQQFDAQGRYVRRWGGPFGRDIPGPFKGWFGVASSVALDGDAVFVADFYHDRVQKFDRRGRYRTSFGTAAGDAPTHTTLAVAADGQGGVFVANYAHHRVEHWLPPPVPGPPEAARRDP